MISGRAYKRIENTSDFYIYDILDCELLADEIPKLGKEVISDTIQQILDCLGCDRNRREWTSGCG